MMSKEEMEREFEANRILALAREGHVTTEEYNIVLENQIKRIR